MIHGLHLPIRKPLFTMNITGLHSPLDSCSTKNFSYSFFTLKPETRTTFPTLDNMKTKTLQFITPLMFLILLGITACKDSSVEFRKYTANVPQYMTYEEMRQPIKSTAASAIETAGKIYIQGNYLFVNEKYKGIHVYDNTNPASCKSFLY